MLYLYVEITNKIKECTYCHKNISILAFNKHFNKCINDHRSYYCEKCGKLVIKKFGTGRFCSQKCAHSRILSEDVKRKIAQKARNNLSGWNSLESRKRRKLLFNNRKKEYYKNPNRCKVCGNVLDYNIKNNKTCGSKICLRKLNSRNGGYKKHSRKGNAGYYKGIYIFLSPLF